MEEETEKMYEDIVKFCRENHTKFVDYQFPPNNKSLGERIVKKLYDRWKISHLNWLRPNQIVTPDNDEGQWSIFNNPKSSDVVQGKSLGNCAIIAAISVIAERPEILDNIFPSKEYSPEGVYRIRFYINGQWKTIIVDDLFPCYVASNRTITVTAKRKQLWASLIEKAMAKQFGNYSTFDEGTPLCLPLSMFTGSSCIHHPFPENPDDIDLFWNTLTSAKSSNFLICCGSQDGKQGVNHEKGVVNHHGYTILDLNDEHSNRLLLLRNPWGHFEWTGKWSTNWDGWRRNSAIADKAKEDGIFWIELDDFMNMFVDVTICRIRPSWHEVRHELTNTSTIRLTVTETCETSFAMFSEKSKISNTKADMMISIHRTSKENIVGEMISRSFRDDCFYLSTNELLLTPGQYIIMIFDLRNLNKINMARIVVCYSSKPIFYELVQQTPQMFNQALREIILKDGEMKILRQYGIFLRFLMFNIKGRIVMADNFRQSEFFHLSLDFGEAENVRSSRGSLETIDVIPPMSYQIITILSPMVPGEEYNCKSKYTNKVSSQKFIGKDDTEDEDIYSQNLQHYPVIDPLDHIYYPQSIFYESVPIETRKCQKRIKHLLRKCDCRA